MIVSTDSALPCKPDSHTFGIYKTWADRLGYTTWREEPETLYLFAGANMFGGFNESVWFRWNQILNHVKSGSVVKICETTGKINFDFSVRLGQKSSSPKLTRTMVNEILETMNEAEKITQTMFLDNGTCKGAIIGDSHSMAYARRDEAVFRHDGQTLRNILSKSSLEEFILKALDGRKPEWIAICLGSIDVRFHVLKPGDEWNNPKLSAKKVVDAAYECQWNLGIPITWCLPIPIEHEDRKMAKTTMLNGQPFTGSEKDRRQWLFEFIGELEFLMNKPNLKIRSFPPSWYSMEPAEYAKKFMTLRSGIHISPHSYNSELNYIEY